MKNDSLQNTYTVNGVNYTCEELHDAVALCYSQIIKHNNNGVRIKQSVYDFYIEAMRKYRDMLKGGIDC